MTIVLAFLFITGLVIGSFLNVVILRTVSEESIVFPGSKCPKCQHPLKWYHNIPLLSYIFLRGKCAFCKEHISIQYPFVELLTGLIFTGLGYLYFNQIVESISGNIVYLLMLIFSIIASCLFIVISGTDIKEMKVADSHTYLLIATGLIYSVIIGSISFYLEFRYGLAKWNLLFTPIGYTLLAIICSFIFMEILRKCANFLAKTEALGDGDSYIFAGVAAVLTSMFGGYNLAYVGMMLLCTFFTSVILSVVLTLPVYLKNIILDKNWYLLGLIAAFTIYTCGYFYANTQGWLDGFMQLIICTIILIILGIALCLEIIKGIGQSSHQSNMIPFGPALTGAGFIALVVLPIILGLV